MPIDPITGGLIAGMLGFEVGRKKQEGIINAVNTRREAQTQQNARALAGQLVARGMSIEDAALVAQQTFGLKTLELDPNKAAGKSAGAGKAKKGTGNPFIDGPMALLSLGGVLPQIFGRGPNQGAGAEVPQTAAPVDFQAATPTGPPGGAAGAPAQGPGAAVPGAALGAQQQPTLPVGTSLQTTFGPKGPTAQLTTSGPTRKDVREDRLQPFAERKARAEAGRAEIGLVKDSQELAEFQATTKARIDKLVSESSSAVSAAGKAAIELDAAQQAQLAREQMPEMYRAVLQPDGRGGFTFNTEIGPFEVMAQMTADGVQIPPDVKEQYLHDMFALKMQEQLRTKPLNEAVRVASEYTGFQVTSSEMLSKVLPTASALMEAIQDRERIVTQLRGQGLSEEEILIHPDVQTAQRNVLAQPPNRKGITFLQDPSGLQAFSIGGDVATTFSKVRQNQLLEHLDNAEDLKNINAELRAAVAPGTVGAVAKFKDFIEGAIAQGGAFADAVGQLAESNRRHAQQGLADPSAQAAIFQDIAEIGAVQFFSTQVAYALARTADKTGRVSDPDFNVQMEGLGTDRTFTSFPQVRSRLRNVDRLADITIRSSKKRLLQMKKEAAQGQGPIPVPGVDAQPPRAKSTKTEKALDTLGLSPDDL